jgi:hypothetical protein
MGAAGRGRLGAVVLAALAVNAALPQVARAETAPEQGELSLRYLHYHDQQNVQIQYPDYVGTLSGTFDRITVTAPSIYLLAPLGAKWSLEAAAVRDDVSGATPRYFTDVSGATPAPGMKDRRTAEDFKLNRHFERAGLSVGVSVSDEDDYQSKAVSLETRLYSENNNTTLTLGLGASNDLINPVNHVVVNAEKRTTDFLVGLTHALTGNDLVQANLSYTNGQGYFTDPYKRDDKRPDYRKEVVLLTRWNHYFEAPGATLRSSYRYYRDSFGIRAHTVEASWVQPLGRWLTLTPTARYYTQSSASFYYDPVFDPNVYPRPLLPQTYYSADERLAAFGAVTVGMKAEVNVKNWSADVSFDRYQARNTWRKGGMGSPNLDPFSWTAIQFGLSWRF